MFSFRPLHRRLLTGFAHNRPRTFRSELEQLEDRITPTATLYVDFGDSFPGGTLNGTTGQFKDLARAPLLSTTTTPQNPSDSLSIQSFNSYIGGTAAADRAAIMARIRQEYKPFDITIVELTGSSQLVNGHSVKAAGSFADMGSILAANNADQKHFDAYIVVGRFTIAGNQQLGYGGVATGVTGNAMVGDFSGMVNLQGSRIEYIADTISHEAGHVFGLKHVYQSGNASQFGQDDLYYPGTVQNANDFAIDDIMSYNHVRPDMTPMGFFFRYPTLDGSKQSGNTFDTLSSTKSSTALQLLEDPNIGRGAYEYVSGTSQNDSITITKMGGNIARVVVTAHRDAAHTLAIPVPGSNGTRTAFSYDITLDRPLLIMTGAGDDKVQIVGGSLGVPIEYDLGTGANDTIDGITTKGDTNGANITTGLFLSKAANTLNAVRLTFSEAVQASTVNSTSVSLTGPGGPVAITGIVEVAGSGGTQFRVNFASQSTAGTYTIKAGPNILDLAGNQMDQNLNGTNGEAADQFSVSDMIAPPADTTGASVSAQFSGVATDSLDTVTLTFSEAVDPATVNSANVTITGPSGPITIGSISENNEGGGTQFVVTFLPEFAAGTYTAQVGVGVLDLVGNPMNQNGNGTNGEPGISPAGDGFEASTTLVGTTDFTGASVTSATFSGDTEGTFDRVRLTFSEPLDPNFGFLISDVVSFTDPSGNTITVDAVTAVGGTTDTFDVTFSSQSAPGTYTIRTGFDIRDLSNNQMDQNLNGTNGEPGLAPTGDEFQATGTLDSTSDFTGARILSAVFGGVAANTFDKVTFTFSEPLDSVYGFIESDIVSFTDPLGNSIFVNSVTAVDGSSTIWDVAFDSQSAPGSYALLVGYTMIDAAGNEMDQNQNGFNGEFGTAPDGDDFQTTGTLDGGTDSTGARILSAVFGGSATDTFDKVTITFNEPLNATSGFFTSDVSSLTDPLGNAITVNSVTAVDGNATIWEVAFDSRSTLGTYTITTGFDIRDASNNQMDQNQNGTNGESGIAPAGDGFQATGTLGSLPSSTTGLAVGGADGSVRLYDAQTQELFLTFFPLDSDAGQYTGLVQVALGDFNADGVVDIAVAAANPLGQAGLDASKAGKVFVYDGKSLVAGNPVEMHAFTPFVNTSGPNGTSGAYVNGLNIDAGDVNGDGVVDLIAGTRGGSATAGKLEFGRLIVVTAGAASDGSQDSFIGSDSQGLTPFGPAYQKGVVVAVGNLDGSGGVEIAVTRGGPVASPNPAIQSIKLKAFQFVGSSLTELNLSGTGAAFAPFAGLSGGNIVRDGRVTFTDSTGTGKAELVFTALDPFSTPGNTQVRVAVFSVDTSTGFATAVSTGSGPNSSYLIGPNIADHAISSTGTGVRNLVLITLSGTPEVQFLDPLTGNSLAGGFSLEVLIGGVTIDGI